MNVFKEYPLKHQRKSIYEINFCFKTIKTKYSIFDMKKYTTKLFKNDNSPNELSFGLPGVKSLLLFSGLLRDSFTLS
ncbi:hypothetical protein BpHYR1_024769 [Brachionus plicatilis]|uniref:Uncharacterized protein n=1 Tax=Brachionus plicatilis TaxID=10195 RepID=A0A3M7SHP7_BRAPC|nr:hypothetical protein BpHYR1_024769 [Brachionus plicatilis]